MAKSRMKFIRIIICLVCMVILVQFIVLSSFPSNPYFYVKTKAKGHSGKENVISYIVRVVGNRFYLWGSLKPRRITYITNGDSPTWKVQWSESVIRVRRPEIDPLLGYFTHKDIVHYNYVLHMIKSSIPKSFLALNITDLLEIREKFPAPTQSFLLEWAAMTKTSPLRMVPLRDKFYHLKILLSKTDPVGQQIKCKGCFKQSFTTFLSPNGVCGGSKEIDLVGIVTTVPDAFTERQAIRDTWGRWTQNNTSNFRLIFLFGGGWPAKINKKLQGEQHKFGDLLQENFYDSYYNLTYKVISGMKWVVKRCPRAKFIMRSAGDCFVHIPSILDLIHTFGKESPFQDYQIGRCLVGMRPYRWLDYKGFVSNMEYALDSYPAYALGTNFLTSMNLTRDILAKVQDTPYMSIEDAYFGIVLGQMGRGCHDIEGFIQNDYVENVSMNDIEHFPYFSQHPVTPEQMYMLYHKSLLYRRMIHT